MQQCFRDNKKHVYEFEHNNYALFDRENSNLTSSIDR